MAVRPFLLAVVLAAFAAAASGQEPQYTLLDQMRIKPEIPVRAVVGSGKIGLMLFHLYPTSLHHFKIIPQGEHLAVTVDPPEMAEFKPTTVETFYLHLVVQGQPKGDRLPLKMRMAADELRSDKEYTFPVPLTKKAEKEVNEEYVVPVGEIEVNVRRYGEEIYYLYVIPIFVMVGWLIWRKTKAAKSRTEE